MIHILNIDSPFDNGIRVLEDFLDMPLSILVALQDSLGEKGEHLFMSVAEAPDPTERGAPCREVGFETLLNFRITNIRALGIEPRHKGEHVPNPAKGRRHLGRSLGLGVAA